MVPCPNCGPRNSDDLKYMGVIKTPPELDASIAQYRRYLYFAPSSESEHASAGWRYETWFCVLGCQQFFDLQRNTLTNEFGDSSLDMTGKRGLSDL